MDKALLDNLWIRFSDFGLHLLGALVVWIIGRALIRFGLNLLVARLERRGVDHTVVGYARSTLSVALNIVLVVVILGVLGIETTSFAAFLAAAGLAIGAAWSGLLSNFAAGAFLIVLRPFKAGDFVSAGGVVGTVSEIGLFTTLLITEDHVRTYIGNSRVLATTLKNYTASTARRLEMTGTIKSSAHVDDTLSEIRSRLLKVSGVLAEPAPEVKLLSFDENGCKLAIRPFVKQDDYWPVYFDSVSALRGLVDAMGGPPSHNAADGESEMEGEEGEEEESEAGGAEE